MREYKQKIRKENGGVIPASFSNREMDLYKRVQMRKDMAT